MKHIGLIAIIFIISISTNAQAQTTDKIQFSSNLISGNNFSHSFPTFANSRMNYEVGAGSYGYTEFNQLYNQENSVNGYFPAYYSSDDFKKSEKSDVSVGKITLEILSGFAGGIIFEGMSAALIDGLYSNECGFFGEGPFACSILFYNYGVGTAFGVYFIGSGGEFNKKSALATLLGSVTGMGVAFLTIYKTDSVEIPLFLGFVLPPIGATIAFNIFDR